MNHDHARPSPLSSRGLSPLGDHLMYPYSCRSTSCLHVFGRGRHLAVPVVSRRNRNRSFREFSYLPAGDADVRAGHPGNVGFNATRQTAAVITTDRFGVGRSSCGWYRSHDACRTTRTKLRHGRSDHSSHIHGFSRLCSRVIAFAFNIAMACCHERGC